MYTLIKHSMPGWTKKFDSIDTLTDALCHLICMQCKEVYGMDLLGLRWSDCGQEFSIVGIEMDEPPTEAEQWQIYLDGK